MQGTKGDKKIYYNQLVNHADNKMKTIWSIVKTEW